MPLSSRGMSRLAGEAPVRACKGDVSEVWNPGLVSSALRSGRAQGSGSAGLGTAGPKLIPPD
jgi:hypothetical protein